LQVLLSFFKKHALKNIIFHIKKGQLATLAISMTSGQTLDTCYYCNGLMQGFHLSFFREKAAIFESSLLVKSPSLNKFQFENP